MKKKEINWLENIYYIGMLASIFFILGQAYYARRSIVESSDWEKAKMTIQNIEQFNERLKGSPLDREEVWMLGDSPWADFSTRKGWEQTDTLRRIYYTLFDNETEAIVEFRRLIDVMDAFAYPIIMGFASDMGSYQSSINRQFYTFGSFIIPISYHRYRNTGVHAKLLYKLWRIRQEQGMVEILLGHIKRYGWASSETDLTYDYHMARIFYDYEETDITEATLKAYRKKLEKKMKEAQKEIEVFRKNSLK